jgi:hypothetical protein
MKALKAVCYLGILFVTLGAAYGLTQLRSTPQATPAPVPQALPSNPVPKIPVLLPKPEEPKGSVKPGRYPRFNASKLYTVSDPEFDRVVRNLSLVPQRVYYRFANIGWDAFVDLSVHQDYWRGATVEVFGRKVDVSWFGWVPGYDYAPTPLHNLAERIRWIISTPYVPIR